MARQFVQKKIKKQEKNSRKNCLQIIKTNKKWRAWVIDKGRLIRSH